MSLEGHQAFNLYGSPSLEHSFVPHERSSSLSNVPSSFANIPSSLTNVLPSPLSHDSALACQTPPTTKRVGNYAHTFHVNNMAPLKSVTVFVIIYRFLQILPLQQGVLHRQNDSKQQLMHVSTLFIADCRFRFR